MKKKYNILIALGSFKDVFSPKESCKILEDAVKNAIDCNIECITMADGGEYSHDVMKQNTQCITVDVPHVVTPHGKKVTVSYLLIDNTTAFVGASEILRMTQEYDAYKNPLNLTSFGLGQLVDDATKKGATEIIIGLGGTNTVDAGIGMAQALGARFLDENNDILVPTQGEYFTGKDLENIYDIDCKDVMEKYGTISLKTLCDGDITLEEMYIPTNQKISAEYDVERNAIHKKLSHGIQSYCNVVERKSSVSREDDKTLQCQRFYGVAGAINLSLKALFPKTMLLLGVDYFIELVKLEEKIKNADLVITGEGRFDNSLMGKTPIGISRLAKKHGKPVVYMCGDVDDSLKKGFTSSIAFTLPQDILDSGVSTLISCHKYYENPPEEEHNKEDKNLLYRHNTPKIFSEALREYFTTKKLEL